MDIVKKSVYYVEYDTNLDMYPIKNFSYKATLDMKCMKLIQHELKEKGIELKVHEIFTSISELNTDVIAILVIEAIKRCTNTTEYEIMKVMDFNLALDLINKLMENCMPINIKSDEFEDEFEDEEDDLSDWDFDYMNYVWHSILKRSDDFNNITPKFYFKQIEVHKSFNKSKEDEDKVEYI